MKSHCSQLAEQLTKAAARQAPAPHTGLLELVAACAAGLLDQEMKRVSSGILVGEASARWQTSRQTIIDLAGVILQHGSAIPPAVRVALVKGLPSLCRPVDPTHANAPDPLPGKCLLGLLAGTRECLQDSRRIEAVQGPLAQGEGIAAVRAWWSLLLDLLAQLAPAGWRGSAAAPDHHLEAFQRALEGAGSSKARMVGQEDAAVHNASPGGLPDGSLVAAFQLHAGRLGTPTLRGTLRGATGSETYTPTTRSRRPLLPDTQTEYVAIASTNKRRRVLTERQKEVAERQRQGAMRQGVCTFTTIDASQGGCAAMGQVLDSEETSALPSPAQHPAEATKMAPAAATLQNPAPGSPGAGTPDQAQPVQPQQPPRQSPHGDPAGTVQLPGGPSDAEVQELEVAVSQLPPPFLLMRLPRQSCGNSLSPEAAGPSHPGKDCGLEADGKATLAPLPDDTATNPGQNTAHKTLPHTDLQIAQEGMRSAAAGCGKLQGDDADAAKEGNTASGLNNLRLLASSGWQDLTVTELLEARELTHQINSKVSQLLKLAVCASA
ncbi:hypothetical protein WJX72_000314 [[Myrmecia] bisecta]|uniref:Uncharacterized protein n=1 Tax=[Myrmecia] bisecta TaxID=41462 RepID=A0AAW1QNV8_9CHLO